MKKKTLVMILAGMLTVTLAGGLIACGSGTGDLDYASNESATEGYDADLFYRNDLVTKMPDPSVISVEENGKTVFWLYGTSDAIESTGYLAYRSEDLVDWTCTGVAFHPEKESWSLRDLWAPEVLPVEIGGETLYLLAYSAGNYKKPANRLSLGIAVAKAPQGPFVQWTGTNADGRNVSIADSWVDTDLFPVDHPLYQRHLIDASLFQDDDGKLYVYFVCDVRDNPAGSSIWGMALKDYMTPDYSTAKQLTMNKKSSPTLDAADLTMLDEDYTNEGPFMIKEGGKYYLTLSVNEYWNRSYSVKQAIADGPLGDFVKVDLYDGGKLLTANEDDKNYVNEAGEQILIDDYDQMSGTGHHSFVKVGDEWWIVYHAHLDRLYGNSARAVAIDRVFLTKNEAGQDILYCNGPTYSVQPLPAAVSGYKNVAPAATVTATNVRQGSSKDYLNDGLVKMHNSSVAKEFIAEGTTEITLEWNDYVYATGLMVYQSFYYDKVWDKVTNIEIESDGSRADRGTYRIGELVFDKDWNIDDEYEFVRAGGSVACSFNEIPVKKITLTIESEKPIAVSDIVVLGKTETNKKSFSAENYTFEGPTGGDSIGWRDNELSDGVTFDGVFDEAVWQNKKWFSFTSRFSDTYSLKMTTHFGAEGVYFAVEVEDPTVSYNSAKPVYQNSSVELMVSQADALDVSPETVQMRIAASGKIETWVGIASGRNVNDGYDYTAYYFDTMVRTKGLGFDVTYMQDKLDVTDVEGYTIEAYMPYSAIGLDYAPGTVKVLPNFNTVLSYASSNRTSNSPDNIPYNSPSRYFTFGANGYVEAEETNSENIGNGKAQSMSGGFNLLQDKGDHPYVEQRAAEQQWAYFKDIEATSYYFTTKITAYEIKNGDKAPKIGLIAGQANGRAVCMFIDAVGLGASNTVCYTGAVGTGDWDWSKPYNMSVSTGRYTGTSSVELGVIRKGSTFYYLVNGKLAGSQEAPANITADTPAEIGFITMNITARFFDYSVTTDASKIDAKLAEVQGTAQTAVTSSAPEAMLPDRRGQSAEKA